jgi:hypothetical protein
MCCRADSPTRNGAPMPSQPKKPTHIGRAGMRAEAAKAAGLRPANGERALPSSSMTLGKPRRNSVRRGRGAWDFEHVDTSGKSECVMKTIVHSAAVWALVLVLAGCGESGPTLQEIASATGYAGAMSSLSCTLAKEKPGHVCSYEYRGNVQTTRLIKTDGGAWRYVEQLDR